MANIGIVLDRTRHAANIGAVCRVMKNLGFRRLHLVNPTEYGHLAAARMLMGAEDILENAELHGSVAEAIGGYKAVFATSHRMKQDEAWDLGRAAAHIADLARDNEVALAFGSEKFGLAREDVDRCGKIIVIPVAADFPSVNLAQAVAMVCIEIKLRMADAAKENARRETPAAIHLPVAGRQRFYNDLFSLFAELGMGAPSVMEKIKAVFDRANMTEREQNLFFGLIKEMRRAKRG